MRSSEVARLAAVAVACSNIVLGSSTTSTSGSATCVTITETTGSGCPAVTGFCARPECVELQTITLECGCPSIFTAVECLTACPQGCGITYDTIYLPCGTSLSSPPALTTTSVSSSSLQSAPPTTSSSSLTPKETGSTTATSVAGGASPSQANEGSKYGFGVVEGGVLLGLILAVLGMA